MSEYDARAARDHGPCGADCGCCDIVDAVMDLYRKGRQIEGVTFMGSPFPPAVTLVDLGAALGVTPLPVMTEEFCAPCFNAGRTPRQHRDGNCAAVSVVEPTEQPPDLCANLIASFDEGERTKPKRGSW